MSAGQHTPAVSVVLCTFNRANLLGGALRALLSQSEGTPPYEVIVVDNNSTDETPEVVRPFLDGGIVRYEFEPEQGLSAARNHGIAAARADIIAFTDDDVRVSAGWIRAVADAFAQRPTVGMIGGRVEPDWSVPPPRWIWHAGTSPLALIDYGNEPLLIARDRPVCLVGANVAVRRSALDRVGGFSTVLQRVGSSVGSTEDHEFQTRLMAAGGEALYEPRMVARTLVPPERLTKRYYRIWHRNHGRYYARMRDAEFERSRVGTFLGVPAHVFRSALTEAASWLVRFIARGASAAFHHELRLQFLAGYTAERMLHRRQPHQPALETDRASATAPTMAR